MSNNTKATILHCIFFASLLICSLCASAQRKRLYIAADDHTDYMWTADEATYDSAFVRMLDYSLRLMDSTKNFPSDFQARFNADGSLWLKAYQKHRSAQQFNRLIAAIKSGHISVPLNMLVNCYGGQPTEAVIRGMYYAGHLERRHGLRFTMAGAMENNTLPLGLASLWAGAGAKYSWKGIGGYGSQLSYEVRAVRPHQMYRYTGLDGSGVLMKWYNYNEKKTPPLGGYAECRLHMKYKNLAEDFKGVINLLDRYCDTISPRSSYPYNVAGAFGFGHDDLETFVTSAYIAAAKAGTTPGRKVRVSNEEDFFKDFEKTYPSVPAQAVTFGNEWDLLPVSMNETTARMRRATEKLRGAEALASLVSLYDNNFLNGLTAMRHQAWESFGVYWEHNWTADGPVSRKARAEWQMRTEENLTRYVDTLFRLSGKKLGGLLKRSVHPTFYVFNPLGWTRSDVADVEYSGTGPVRIVDQTTGKEVPHQAIVNNGKQALRIWAEDLPSVGYKVFEIRNEKPVVQSPAATVSGEVIANKFYRLRFTPSGVITELFDSLMNRQLVQQTAGRYLNDLGTTDVMDGAPVVVENSGPVSVTLKAVSKNPLPHTVRLTLFANSPCITIEDSIQANFGDVKTWAFSFNLSAPTTRHEELGAILTAKKQARGGHYANSIARYDWQTFNHFADLGETDYGVTLSNVDCSFFKLGGSTIDSLWETSSQISALAGGNVDKKVEDGGVLGILNQNGQNDFRYQFALTTRQQSFDAAGAMKFALEHQNALVAEMITGERGMLPEKSYSLLQIDKADVLLWSVKPSEEGIKNGLIARLWNLTPKPVATTLRLSRPVTEVWQTSSIETNQKKMATGKAGLQVQLAQQQMKTYRIRTLATGTR